MTESTKREELLSNREPIRDYWRIRLEKVKQALEKNNFGAFLVESGDEAKRLVMEDILPGTGAKSVAWGGTMTMEEIGLGEALRQRKDLAQIDPMAQGLVPDMDHLRKAFTADLFFSGTNAVTGAGQLVNLDMLGNRISAITFGPTHVVILVGRNKIVRDLEGAMERIRTYVSPAHVRRINALMGFEMENPCVKSASCQNCRSPMRICNAWSIIEKSYPQGRIKVVLINEDLGV
jgi:L-lactate utilization protein LutB